MIEYSLMIFIVSYPKELYEVYLGKAFGDLNLIMFYDKTEVAKNIAYFYTRTSYKRTFIYSLSLGLYKKMIHPLAEERIMFS